MSIETAQSDDPKSSQKRFPLIRTKMNMKATAETSFTTPKIPVRNNDDETVVKPADMNMTGASKILLALCSRFISIALK